MRDFTKWLSTFKESIADYKYYISFDNVYKNTNEFKIELNILNSLRGSKSIKNEFLELVEKYPESLRAVPILLAKRESEISCTDNQGTLVYNFRKKNLTAEQYAYFMEQTGLFDLMSNHLIGNLCDYVLGVNTGLDSNARKNRGGHLMEDLIEKYIKDAGFVLGKTYFKEMRTPDLAKKFNLDLSAITNGGSTIKRFDYVVKTDNCVYGIECNFYASSGSKLNETARSYKMLAEESKKVNGFKFVWFTDGIGWNDARNNLKETFDVMNDIYNISEVESGIIKKVFK